MNVNTISTECGHRMHSACTYEDCACDCHLDVEAFDEQDNRYKWPEDRR